jgi:uncharacterized glyoxalase superfamily protein PhnB
MTGSTSKTNRIEEVFPYLRTRDANAAIEFYQRAFGAVEDFRLTEPSGRVGHAELKFGETTGMVSDAYPEYGIHGPRDGSPTGLSIHLHVDDVDAMTRQAAEAGAKVVSEPSDQFYGERTARLLDPFGHEWLLGSHTEDVSREEMQRRFTAMFEA